MENKKYLAVDAGGTKVLAVLYDENYNILGSCRTGSFRRNTTPIAMIQKNLDKLVQTLNLSDNCTLDRVSGVLEGDLLTELNKVCRIRESDAFGELEAGLCAAEIYGDGLLALSGTGSALFARYMGKAYVCGGYGASISDEGSGYWMARQAFGAAIKDFEKRGPETLLTDLIAERFGRTRNELNSAISSIYSNSDIPPVASVAFCAPLVTQAADAGDKIALDILRETGKVLGEQMNSLTDRYKLPNDLIQTVSGSVWKSHPVLWTSFVETIYERHPDREIRIPKFEPIIGVILHHYNKENGKLSDAERQRFIKLYRDYAFITR